jgi:hypothetical protein
LWQAPTEIRRERPGFESGADNIRRYEDETKMEMVCDDECGNAAVWRMFTKEHAG